MVSYILENRNPWVNKSTYQKNA